VATITNVATGAFTYVPNPDANGVDTFTFQVSDGVLTSNIATVTVTITPVDEGVTVTLSNLSHVYDGAPKSATATTLPSGLTVELSYAQGGTPVAAPTSAGSYDVTATVSQAGYAGSATGTLVIATTYTGAPQSPSSTTGPAGLAVSFVGAPQTSAGSYPVTATISDPNYDGTASGTFVIAKAAATVTLANLAATYTGAPQSPSATTVPAGLTVTLTGAPQANAGSYPVTATVNDANYDGSASGTFVIAKAAATVTLTNLSATYTGAPQSPSATTVPAGLTVTLTGAPQTNAGSYPVTATVNDANYEGAATGTFVIAPAGTATVTLSNLEQTYTGSPLSVTVTTTPPGLAVSVTNGTQTNAGSYPVTATITDPNYTGSTSGTFVIAKAAATVTLTNLAATYTGAPQSPSVTTVPVGLPVTLTGAPQTAAGSYPVTATITSPNYTGATSGTFVIAKAPATVTLTNLTQAFTGTPLTPTATTVPPGLAVTLTGAPQTAAASYPVTATITDANYTGTASGTFVITSVVASPMNVALASNGGTATASSTANANYPPSAAIDGRRSGSVRGQQGTWEDATQSVPDWLQVNFAAASTINLVNVFSVQVNGNSPVEPTPTLTSYIGVEDFTVQYWTGTTWAAIPGGQVVGNNLVWRAVNVAPITTTAIRIFVTKVYGGGTRLTEVEAWTAGPQPPPNQPPTVSLAAPAANSSYNPGAAVAMTATANDADGFIARVDFRVDGQVVGSDTSAPYAFTWTAAGVGAHTLTAVAVDSANASTTSNGVPIAVTLPSGGGRVNVALATNGGTATASSTANVNYPPSAAIDGRRSGAVRGQRGTWEDATQSVPDWLQVNFAGPSTIDLVNVFSVQVNGNSPVEPTPTLTSYSGVEDFTVQYWNGTTWAAVPGGAVVGNNLVWRSVSFAPITTTAIRIFVTKVYGGGTRLTEVEAWTPPTP
jgi:hypothetical protein